MKKTRKVLARVLTLALALSLFSVNAFAAADGTLTVEAGSVTAAPGETVDVTVSITGNPGIVGFGLGISYDEAALTLKTVTDAGVFGTGGATINQNPNDDSCDCYVLFAKPLNTGNISTTGKLLTLSFTVAANAADDDYAIVLAVDDATSTTLSAVSGAAVNGKITVGGTSTDVPTVENQTGATPTATVSFSEDGKTMNVKNDAACVVLVKKTDGTYTKLTVQAGGSAQSGYNFDVSGLAAGESIVVAVKGDANGDGQVTIADRAAIAFALLGSDNNLHKDLSAMGTIVGDVNGDSQITIADRAAVAFALLGSDNSLHKDLAW